MLVGGDWVAARSGETFEGRCDGKKLIWCENKAVKTLNCTNQCGFNTQQGYNDCL